MRRACQIYWERAPIRKEKQLQVHVVMVTDQACSLTDRPVDGVTKALLKITESKFESQISSPLMDTILQPSPTRSRDDHMISDDIIESVIEVSMIIMHYS